VKKRIPFLIPGPISKLFVLFIHGYKLFVKGDISSSVIQVAWRGLRKKSKMTRIVRTI
jgi:hypothetical protein